MMGPCVASPRDIRGIIIFLRGSFALVYFRRWVFLFYFTLLLFHFLRFYSPLFCVWALPLEVVSTFFLLFSLPSVVSEVSSYSLWSRRPERRLVRTDNNWQQNKNKKGSDARRSHARSPSADMLQRHRCHRNIWSKAGMKCHICAFLPGENTQYQHMPQHVYSSLTRSVPEKRIMWLH